MEFAFPPILGEVHRLPNELQDLYVHYREAWGPYAQGPVALAALALAACGVLWILRPDAPGWWPLSDAWWLPGGLWTGVTQVLSAFIAVDGLISWQSPLFQEAWRVEARGCRYVGLGVSGGELGALNGPSLMPGGSAAAWDLLRPVFEAICARTPESRWSSLWLIGCPMLTAAGSAAVQYNSPKGLGAFTHVTV